MRGRGFRRSMKHPSSGGAMTVGLMSGARGACPVCGRDVERRHLFDGARLRDSYGCLRCGPTVYSVAVRA